MIDREKIEGLFNNLEEYLVSLKEFQNISKKKYLSDKRNVYTGRYLLQVCIESCINIGNHIISLAKFETPKEYSDTFRILNKHKIIPDKLLNKLILMTKFRNRIVHLYWDIDDDFVYDIIKLNLIDIESFVKAVKRYIKKLEK